MQAIIAAFASQPAPLLWGLAGVLAALTLGALAAVLLPRLKPGRDYRNLQERMASWWVMAALIAGALLGGWATTTALFTLISFLALKEFLSLAPVSREDRPLILASYLVILASYGFVVVGQYMFYVLFIPVYVFIVMPFAMACLGQTKSYLPRASLFHWGLVTCVYNLGFIALLMRVPAAEAPQAGAAGLVFMLLLPTTFCSTSPANCSVGERSCPRSVLTRPGRGFWAAGYLRRSLSSWSRHSLRRCVASACTSWP